MFNAQNYGYKRTKDRTRKHDSLEMNAWKTGHEWLKDWTSTHESLFMNAQNLDVKERNLLNAQQKTKQGYMKFWKTYSLREIHLITFSAWQFNQWFEQIVAANTFSYL